MPRRIVFVLQKELNAVGMIKRKTSEYNVFFA